MKVKNSKRAPGTGVSGLTVERKNNVFQSRQFFERHFNTMGQEQYELYIAELTEKIDEQSRRLAQKVDIAEMERFRTLISEFLNEIVSSAYTYQKEKIFDAKGKYKVYATVNKINEELEKLANDILHGSRDRLKIISKIDNIKGLIIDMLR